MAKIIHKAVVRGITREDLNDSIQSLSTLVDAKLDTVIVKVANIHETILSHIAQEGLTTAQIRRDLLTEAVRLETKQNGQHKDLKEELDKAVIDLESLKKYRWFLGGAIVVIVALIEMGLSLAGVFHTSHP